MACGMSDEGDGEQRLKQEVLLVMDLQDGFISLGAFTGSLLRRLVVGHLFIEITFAFTAGQRSGAVDAKILRDEVPVDLVFEDQAPFAESLGGDQQDQCYGYGIFHRRGKGRAGCWKTNEKNYFFSSA